MKKLFAFLALALSMNAFAGNVEAGKVAAQKYNCASCHGADFNSPIDPSYPKLAGQYPDYLLKALKEYKSGKRVNAVMAGQVQALTDADMANLAVYYGSLKGQMGIVK